MVTGSESGVPSSNMTRPAIEMRPLGDPVPHVLAAMTEVGGSGPDPIGPCAHMHWEDRANPTVRLARLRVWMLLRMQAPPFVSHIILLASGTRAFHPPRSILRLPKRSGHAARLHFQSRTESRVEPRSVVCQYRAQLRGDFSVDRLLP